MIDCSNNNEWIVRNPLKTFTLFYRSGQRRCYVKSTEGAAYKDPDAKILETEALRAGLMVGRYHFARPSLNHPSAELSNALSALDASKPKRGKNLRFVLDVEDPHVRPQRSIGMWVEDFCGEFPRHYRYLPIIYGSFYYLQACRLDPRRVGPLWLAWYSRDGKYHGATATPGPWVTESALQWSPMFHYPWMPEGTVIDISHVFRPADFDIPSRLIV